MYAFDPFLLFLLFFYVWNGLCELYMAYMAFKQSAPNTLSLFLSNKHTHTHGRQMQMTIYANLNSIRFTPKIGFAIEISHCQRFALVCMKFLWFLPFDITTMPAGRRAALVNRMTYKCSLEWSCSGVKGCNRNVCWIVSR